MYKLDDKNENNSTDDSNGNYEISDRDTNTRIDKEEK